MLPWIPVKSWVDPSAANVRPLEVLCPRPRFSQAIGTGLGLWVQGSLS